jgi:hypothetical protein
VTDPDSFVPTIPPNGFPEFLQQRTRHFSAGKYFPPSMKLFFLIFHTANLAFLVAIVGSFLFGQGSMFIWPYLAKCLVDSCLFLIAAPVFRETRFAPSYLLMELLYVLYNTMIGPLGFIRRFEWKAESEQ